MNQKTSLQTACAPRQPAKPEPERENGFTLIETCIAMVIMMVAALGAASLFGFAIGNNSAGSDRAQAFALAQQSLEQLRNVSFTSSNTDASLNATNGSSRTVIGADGRFYNLTTTITDSAAGTPTGAPAGVLKTIRIDVTPNSSGTKWAVSSAISRVTVWTQRARSN
jgi:Tfp pilus assembly protein PilV